MSSAWAADLAFAIDIGVRAGAVLMDRYERLERIHHKSAKDVVTEADTMSERLIMAADPRALAGRRDARRGVRRPRDAAAAPRRPTSTAGSWVIDPLDGTVNYANGIPFFCVSIAPRRGRPAGRRHRP